MSLLLAIRGSVVEGRVAVLDNNRDHDFILACAI